MIHYKNGRFGMLSLVQLNGSVVPAALLIALPASSTVAVLRSVLPLITNSYKTWTYSTAGSNIWSGFNLILGFLIVFRSQQAYSRWWEGGTLLKQMRGDWFNAYSSLLAFTNPAPEKQDEVAIFQHQIVRLFSLLHGAALEFVTDMKRVPLDTIELQGFDADKLLALRSTHNKVEVILQWIQRLIVQSDSAGVIKVAPPILSRVYNELGNGIVYCNNAKKIGHFPFPFPMAQLMAIMLGFHLLLTMYISVVFVPGDVDAFCTSFAVLFAFWSINLVSIEIEMPFACAIQRSLSCSLSLTGGPTSAEGTKVGVGHECWKGSTIINMHNDGRCLTRARFRIVTQPLTTSLEMPFGEDLNDLPLFEMQTDFNLSLSTLLEPAFLSPPKYSPDTKHQQLIVNTASLDGQMAVAAGERTIDAAEQSIALGETVRIFGVDVHGKAPKRSFKPSFGAWASRKGLSEYSDVNAFYRESRASSTPALVRESRASSTPVLTRETIVEETESEATRSQATTPDADIRSFTKDARNIQDTINSTQGATRITSPRKASADDGPCADKQKIVV